MLRGFFMPVLTGRCATRKVIRMSNIAIITVEVHLDDGQDAEDAASRLRRAKGVDVIDTTVTDEFEENDA